MTPLLYGMWFSAWADNSFGVYFSVIVKHTYILFLQI